MLNKFDKSVNLYLDESMFGDCFYIVGIGKFQEIVQFAQQETNRASYWLPIILLYSFKDFISIFSYNAISTKTLEPEHNTDVIGKYVKLCVKV